MRERHVAKAGRLVETASEIGVKRSRLSPRAPCLCGVDIEQQQTVWIESELDGLEVREGSCKQTRGHEQQQRHDQLRDDQRLHRSHPRPEARPPTRIRKQHLLQCRDQRRPGGLQRRREAEEKAARNREHKSDGEDTPVETGVDQGA
jgi:hypothetical protein